MSAGKDYGVRNAGYYALRHLRIENFFAFWGLDLNERTTPMECGRGFRVRFDVSENFRNIQHFFHSIVFHFGFFHMHFSLTVGNLSMLFLCFFHEFAVFLVSERGVYRT
jgi:hypothetical protein